MSPKVPTHKTHIRWLVYHLLNQKLLVVSVLVGIGIVTLSRVLVPVVLGEIIDNALLTNDLTNLVALLSVALFLYLFRNVMDYVVMMVGHFLGMHTEQDMRQEFFDAIQQKPLRFHDKARSGDLQALTTNDLRIINTMISHGSFYIYPFIQGTMAMILLFFTLDTRMALLCSPFIIVYMYFVLDYRKKIAPIAAERMVAHSNVAVVLQDSLSGAPVIKAFTTEELERDKFHKAVIGYRDNRVRESIVHSRFYPLLILYLAIGTTFLISVLFVFEGSMTIGALTATNLLLVTLIHPTDMIFWATNDMMSGFAACARLHNALITDLTEDQDEDPEQEWFGGLSGRIEFRNVTFAYENGVDKPRPVLRNVSFTIEPNQRVALVGPTGCGKTTLVKLLLRLYNPQEGMILLDGVDIQTIPSEVIRRNIGYIEQEIYLFSRTIRENITFGRPEASLDDVRKVADLAQVSDFINNFHNGLETMVGERGLMLSGGEKQRVAIARALLTNPDILILDDSASALDSETEDKITKAIENVVSNRTTIVITHRLQTIRSSDKILVLKKGEVIAEGKHQELLDRSEDYRRIFGKHLALPKVAVNK